MAKKPVSKKKTNSQSDANVTRIKAGSSAPKKTKAVEAEVVAEPVAKKVKEKKAKTKRGNRLTGMFSAIGAYFKGAWVELRQVRWPTRRATWGLTGAVLLYSAFFVVVVLLLDALFKYLFELILGK